jgi:UPF0755 protein
VVDSIRRSSGWLKLFAIIIPILLVFVGASLFAVNSWYNQNLKPLAADGAEDVIVLIESGTSLREIASQLEDLGVIRNATVFSWYVGRNDVRADLKAGTYRLNPSQDVATIAQILANGDVATNLFTIFPGRRLDQIEQDLIEFGFTPEAVTTALNTPYDHPLFEGVPSNATLEGYIYPDTYEITADTTPEQILEKSFDAFYAKISSSIRAGIKKQGLNFHQAITLSSLVEMESGDLDDQPQIAQVFLKRLREDMQLGSDVTFFYAAALTGEDPSPDLDSPYNTRLYKGLPPGPIANFNVTALEAVAEPAKTEWLFFVAGDDGITYFSKTIEEHERLVEEHCIENCKLPS